jgi:hypothetical protein
MTPYGKSHREAIAKFVGQIWELNQDLKGFRYPDCWERQHLGTRFDALCGERTGLPGIDGVLGGLWVHRGALARGPGASRGMPLHTNPGESHIRDDVKKRKDCGGKRSELGLEEHDTFVSLKKARRELGVNFWAYLQGRVRRAGQIPRMVKLVRRKAEEAGARKAGAALPA